jgi:catechol 2,3-dioxygenase-like lactoylglutathione lyase family enzyme
MRLNTIAGQSMRHLLAALLLLSSLQGQTKPPRPHVLGIAHVAFQVSDVSRTEAFYENLLGYEEPFSLKDNNGKITTAFVKVNDLQYVELFPGNAQSQGQLDHFALYTDDVISMRAYLQAQGISIFKDIRPGRVGNDFLSVRDPDGHLLEILQYSQNSLTAQSKGKFMPAGRISDRITHVGVLVSSVKDTIKFYRDAFGFRELVRGGQADGQPTWIALQAPDGSDYIELIPFSGVPEANLTTQNHFGLASADLRKTVARLQTRAAGNLLTSPPTVRTKGDLPPRVDVFDPDGARVEIMEPMLAPGQPTDRHPREQ